MGPNFFIWIAMGVVVLSTGLAMGGQEWAPWGGYPIAIALAIFNKVRAVRRRRTEAAERFE